MTDRHNKRLQSEFNRTAEQFAQRTKGRFDTLGALEFSRVSPNATILEVGAGTGNFLRHFEGGGRRLVALDLTEGMLRRAAKEHPDMILVRGDGTRLPIATGCIDLVASAQALHHVHEPLPLVKEMRRAVRGDGWVLIVDQVATERHEEAQMMTKLDVLRDPSHAMSRPPSAMRVIVRAAGLEIVDERLVVSEERLSNWMWPEEFPAERIKAVARFIDQHGSATGMEFRRDGDDWSYERRRMMILARRAP